MLDMPLFLKIMKYFFEHPEIDQQVRQNLIWKLVKKPKFEELTKEEQELLFNIDPYADAEINNYKSVTYPEWLGYPKELWPEEIVPQPIPNSKLFAKFTRIKGFSEAEIEFYNPTAEAQSLILLKMNPGSLTGNFFNAIRQRLGFTTPGGKHGYFENGGLGGMFDDE